MDEEEEIDIIGESFENFMSKNEQDISKISSGQILSCDYTVHPNWLHENAEAGSYWTDSVPKNENLESNVKILHSEEVVIEEPEPVPNITDFEWTPGIGAHEDLVFEDDIPASIEEVVTNQDGEEDIAAPKNYASASDSDHFELETAAFETHPPPENIKFIGPTHSRSLLKVKMESPVGNVNALISSRSLLKKNIKPESDRPISKFKQTLLVNPSLLQKVQKSQAASKVKYSEISVATKTTKQPKKTPPKFKETVKMSYRDLQNGKLGTLSRKYKGKEESKNKQKSRKIKKARNLGEENITISHEMESSTTGNSVQSGVVVQLNRCETDSDVEIDIESDPPSSINKEVRKPEIGVKPSRRRVVTIEPIQQYQEIPPIEEDDTPKIPLEERFPNLSETLLVELQNHDIPAQELKIDPGNVSDLEKFIHSDFFENRTTKTPEQYLRIRNHILCMWQSAKPNYISKTAVRVGLKHGGDVNCISRIHRLLEQMGAINFGLHGKCFDYVRPLETFISMFIQVPRNRTNSNSFPAIHNYKERRQRIRTNTFNTLPGLDVDDADVNFTIVHMDGVARPQLLAQQRDKHSSKPRLKTHHIKSELDLIKCLKFSEKDNIPISISITLSTLLCLRMHALSSNYEVMGFLGGRQSLLTGRKHIDLTRYKPCRTSAQSGTTCEMCPVSQVEQSASLNAEGYELLGWFHSHPLFPANPSRTDIRTQKEMQMQFSFDNNRPFVGLILSCLDFSLKCIYMMSSNRTESEYDGDSNLPYEIDVDIKQDCGSFSSDIRDVLYIIQNGDTQDFNGLCNKFKTSSEIILQQLGYDSKTFFDKIF